MAEEKVLALHYAEPTGDKAQLRCNLVMVDKVEAENFIRSGRLRVKSLLRGAIKAIYSEKGRDNLIHKDTGEVFRGPVMFIGYDKEKPVNLRDNQIKAIKAIYRKAE